MKDIIESLVLFFFVWDWSDPIEWMFALGIYTLGSLILVTQWVDLLRKIFGKCKPRR